VKDIRSILRLTHEHGLSVRAVSERLKISKTSVSTYLLRAREAGLSGWPLPPDYDDDAALERLLFQRVGRPPRDLSEPDWPMIAAELKRKGVTLTLLWQEYRAAHPDGYGYTWFCERFIAFQRRTSATFRIASLLPSERGRWARPAQDNRRYLNGMLHVLRIGCPWRDMHERYGKWNSVYVRFRRWAEQGVWDALLETLVEMGLTDDWQHMVDSTSVRGHSQAAGAKGGRIRRVLVEAAVALRARSTPVQTVRDALLASS